MNSTLADFCRKAERDDAIIQGVGYDGPAFEFDFGDRLRVYTLPYLAQVKRLIKTAKSCGLDARLLAMVANGSVLESLEDGEATWVFPDTLEGEKIINPIILKAYVTDTKYHLDDASTA